MEFSIAIDARYICTLLIPSSIMVLSGQQATHDSSLKHLEMFFLSHLGKFQYQNNIERSKIIPLEILDLVVGGK